jgi:phthiocerol/phenolphthiocerol synthesis type-I polyketide synthase E
MTERGGPSMLPPNAIAIVGLAGRFPGASSLDAFWQNIRAGVESLEEFSDADLDAAGVPADVRAGSGFVPKGTALEDAEHFDAGFFGYSPREAQAIDPQHRIFLECAWEALEHAGYAAGIGQESVAVYAGASMNTYLLSQVLGNPSIAASIGRYQLMLGNDKDFLCTRVSYKLDLRGPSVTVQTACSTSLVAVEMACRALQRGECDMALAGGVSVAFPQRGGHLYQEGMIFSPDAHCRPFDADARGTRVGAGAGIVVLKRLSDAIAAGDTVHAVIRGAAINNDGGNKAGYTAPSIEGQIEVIAMAQALAGVEPRSISYIEAHGTATPLGDPIEISALTQAFRGATDDVGFCRIGSLKANLGHLDAAAGVAGLIKTVLALRHREIPPLVNFKAANPQLELDSSPFVASSNLSPWTVGDGGPRRAGVSSFGIGGTNAHVVLEEAPLQEAVAPKRNAHLLLLSAKTATALEAATVNLAAHLESAAPSIADVEWTLQAGRQAFAHRRAVVVRDTASAAAALRAAPRPPVVTGLHEGGPRPVAFMFSGQGSQHPGMGASLYDTESAYRDTVDRCAASLVPHLGIDIRELLLAAGDDQRLHQTRYTQPALFVTELAVASMWMRWGITPQAMIGHSIGEYVAAHLAGVMSIDDALKVVAARGRLMQELPGGSMAAVHMSAAELAPLISGGVEIAAINAPRLVAVSGPTAAVETLVSRLQKDGVDARLLRTSHAFHSAMMEPVLGPFTEVFDGVKLSPPQIPYVSNVTGSWIRVEQATSPAYYAQHMRAAVAFEKGLRTLAADQSVFLLEVGPGTALTSLAQQTIGTQGANRVAASLPNVREARSATEGVLEAAGRLWLQGVPLDWAAVHDGATVRRVPLPTYPFERQRFHVPAAAARSSDAAPTSGGIRAASRIDEWMFAPTWTRDDVGEPQALTGRWLVLGDDGPLTTAIAGRLSDLGAHATVVVPGISYARLGPNRFQARPASADDIASISRELAGAQANPLDVSGVIHLWGVTSQAPAHRELGDRSFLQLIALTSALGHSRRTEPWRIVHVSAGSESVFGEPVTDPYAAVAMGPVLVLPTETPGLNMRSVDIESASEAAAAAAAIVAEAALDDTEQIVARRMGRRWVRRFERLSLPRVDRASLPLKAGGIYVITGGTGGMGLTFARWLGETVSARLLLTTRTPLPPRRDWDEWIAAHPADNRHVQTILTIRHVEQAGGEVIVAVADVADEAAMSLALGDVASRWGRPDGVIHAAGVTGGGAATRLLDPADAAATITPKVNGLDVLVRLLGSTPLDFVALMGAINAVVGVPGTADYAAANAVFDAFVDSATRPASWRQVVAVDWGAWRDVGMAARLAVPDANREQWQAFMETAIAPADGVEAFARVLASRRRRVVIVPYDLIRLAQRGPGQVATTWVARTQRTSAVPATQPADSATSLSGELEPRVAAIWSELLGLEAIAADDDFFQLGGHSLMATRLLARIDEDLGVKLSLRDVFESPTVRLLSEKIGAIAAPRANGELDSEREEIEF